MRKTDDSTGRDGGVLSATIMSVTIWNRTGWRLGKTGILYTYLEWVERETTWINELSGSDTAGMECALTIAKVNAVTEFVKNLVKEDAWEIDTTNLSTK